MHIKTSDQEVMVLGFGNYTCNWGAHLCGFYEKPEERDEIIFNFLRQGCMDGDLQLYCPAERPEDDFARSFSKFCPACSSDLSDPQRFRILKASELYYPDGVFSPRKMDYGLNSFYESSQKCGHRRIRATAEMVWALETIPGVENLMVYEARLNYFIPGKPWTSICMYNVTQFSGDIILKVLQTHPYSLSGGIIMQNPQYISPDIWLAENAPDYVKN